MFWSFGIIEFIYSHFENRVLLKSVLGGVAGFAHFITGQEQTQLNLVCYFHFYDVLLASKGSNSSELNYPATLYVHHGFVNSIRSQITKCHYFQGPI